MDAISRLAEDIAASGTKLIFGITGSGRSLELVDSLEKRGVGFVRTQFEGSAAMMAATQGRLSGCSGVAVCIKGPGLTNLVPGLAVAKFETFPLVGICEAYGSSSPASKAHKRIDQIELAGELTKARQYLSADGDGFSEIARFAESEVPGPVLLQLSDQPEPRPSQPITPPSVGPNDAVVEMAAAAQNPVIIAGTLAVRREWSGLLEKLSLPVFSTVAAKGVLNERAEHSAGIFTGVGRELAPETAIIEEADFVLGLGLRPSEVLATRRYGPNSAKFANIEQLQEIAGQDGFRFDAVGSVDQVNEVMDALNARSWGHELVSSTLSRVACEMNQGTFLPWHAFKIIESALGATGRVIADTGNFCTVAEHAWRAERVDEFLLSGQGRYMGTGIPMAIAAALHDQSMPHIAVVGDGGIGPFIGELRLAIERNLPLLVVLMTDGRFGSVATRALKDGLTMAPLTMENSSWLREMDGFGFSGTQVKTASAFEEALNAWNRDRGPAFIEIEFDADAYEKMVHALR